jgi:hypothetical protein
MRGLSLAVLILALVLVATSTSAQLAIAGSPSPSKDLPLVDESKPVFTDDQGRLYHEQPYEIWKEVIIIKKGMRNINVRSGPATSFKPPLGKVNELEVYDYLGLEDGWYKFNYHGQVAYIAERFARYKEKGRRVQAPEPRRIYVRRKTFFEKGVGVGPYPEFPLWGAYLAGLVVVLLIIVGSIRGARRRHRERESRDRRRRESSPRNRQAE